MASAASITHKLLSVFRTVHRTKEMPRQGEIYFGMKLDESDSIASHSFLVVWIARLMADSVKDLLFDTEADKTRFVRDVTFCALLHDVSESVAGDLYHKTKEQIREHSQGDIEKQALQILESGIEKLRLSYYFDMYEHPGKDKYKLKVAMIVTYADGLDSWLHGMATPSAWWPAWENYNRGVQEKIQEREKLSGSKGQLMTNLFRRMCDIAHYPDFDVKIRAEDDCGLSDEEIRSLVSCFKKLYTLKGLPRHGFTIFGMKRAETDSFAEHIFTSSFLSYLLAICWLDETRFSPEQALQAIETSVLLSLLHDLPSAIAGDVSFDLQVYLTGWHKIEQVYLHQLFGDTSPYPQKFVAWHAPQDDVHKFAFCIARTASLIDAWEVGVTTPSAWMNHWYAYRKRSISLIAAQSEKTAQMADEACNLLAEKDEQGYFVIQPVRLTQQSGESL